MHLVICEMAGMSVLFVREYKTEHMKTFRGQRTVYIGDPQSRSMSPPAVGAYPTALRGRVN